MMRRTDCSGNLSIMDIPERLFGPDRSKCDHLLPRGHLSEGGFESDIVKLELLDELIRCSLLLSLSQRMSRTHKHLYY